MDLTRQHRLLFGAALLSGFGGGIGAGRSVWKHPTEVRVETRAVEVVRTVVQRAETKVLRAHVVTEVKRDGTKVITRDTVATTDSKITRDFGKASTTVGDSRTQPPSNSQHTDRWRIGVLVGTPLRLPVSPIYGGSLDRRVFGGVWLGVWGLNNGTVGVSVSGQF